MYTFIYIYIYIDRPVAASPALFLSGVIYTWNPVFWIWCIMTINTYIVRSLDTIAQVLELQCLSPSSVLEHENVASFVGSLITNRRAIKLFL